MRRRTIDIDAAVLRELERRQRREGKSLDQLVSELLALALRGEERGTSPFTWVAKEMGPRVDLEDPEAVRRSLEGA